MSDQWLDGSKPIAEGRRLLFEGDRGSVATYVRRLGRRYYVYILCRPSGEPFYVGKGQNKRVLEHEAEARRHHPIGESNPFKCNVIRKIIRDNDGVIYRIDSAYEADAQLACLEREAELIRRHRRLHEGGCLTNLAGGLGNLSGAAPFSLERHSATLSGAPTDNPKRAILNELLQGIGPVGSVPIKPREQMARILPSIPHPQPRAASLRCAYALIASATAAGKQLVAGVRIPRSFVWQGVTAVIENGVSRDILKADMASLVPNTNPIEEAFLLSAKQVNCIVGLIGRHALVARGLI